MWTGLPAPEAGGRARPRSCAGEPVHERAGGARAQGRRDARVLYLDLPNRGSAYLVAIFGKREKSDLTMSERDLVAAVVKRIKEEA